MSKNKKEKKLVQIILTMREIWMHTAHKVQKNKKKYNRKSKHRKNGTTL